MRTLLTLSLSLLLACTSKIETPSKSEILWDSWGIPHIYGTSTADLYKMMGWAQARNHGNLLLKLYGEARGRASEYWEGDFQRDYLLHQLGLIEASQQSYETMDLSSKEIIDAFAEGINAYATKFPDELDTRFKKVLPIKPADIVAHAFRVMYLEFLINRNLRSTQNWSAGSNAWAINNTKTANSSTMLLANPHLPWQGCWLFFEAQLITSSNNLYGATLIGLPIIGIGFNDQLGWTHTVNTLDNVDFYEINVENDRYEMDNEYVAFEMDSLVIRQTVDGAVQEVPLLRKRSAFGVILKEEEGKALAIRWPNMDGKLDILGQWKAMGKARSLTEFQSTLKINSLPLFNIVYADKKGNILYHFGGNIPKKVGGWDRWQSVVQSNSSKDIWQTYYAADEVPSYLNPPSHWIQNANDPPFTSTIPPAITPSDYPSHIAPNRMSFRPQRSVNLIKAADNLSLEEFAALKHDTRSELWLRLKDDFAELKDHTSDSLTLAALDVLAHWDGQFNEKNQEPLLFITLFNALDMNRLFKTGWSYDSPLTTPDGFKDPKNVLAALKGASQDLLGKYGTLKVPFGELFKVKTGDHTFGGNGGPGRLGLFRTMNYIPGKDKFYSYHGDSYVCVTEFGEEIRAKALLAYGNATQPGNPHVGDQLKLYAEKKLRDVWLTRTQHEANLELKEDINAMKVDE